MEQINNFLSGIILPAMLILSGMYFGIRLKFFYIFHPVKFVKTLKDASSGEKGISPFRALSQALAGTLGVGNMAGVATAICAGGAGAVFWMWVSAVIAMSVKYYEVYLGVEHRRKCDKTGEYYGGAMYYISDGVKQKFPKISSRTATAAGGIFAVLCIANSLLMGNIVQMNAAASVFPGIPPLLLGTVAALIAFFVAAGNTKRVTSMTARMIPLLTLAYSVISVAIIIKYRRELPAVFEEIFTGAFSLKAAGGGAGGYAISRAVRFGVSRGLFSNEAGCGTSPTAHAAANCKSPHHQGCMGIFEVFADTVVLCTMTAFVILISQKIAPTDLDGIPLTVYSYSFLAGKWAGTAMGVSVILFAFSTVICVSQYGKTAMRYLNPSPKAGYIFYAFSAAATVFGTVISAGFMWQAADFTVSLMTVLNVCCIMCFAQKTGS